MIPQEYLKWQSTKEKGEFKPGQVNHVNCWLGTGIKGIPWGAINVYLPDKPSQYKNYTIVSKYNESEDRKGIEVLFMGSFSNSIKKLSSQVVFKISENDENVLTAEFWDKDKTKYELPDELKYYELVSWTMTRTYSQYQGVNYESALVSMKWAWTGEIEKGDGTKRHNSELQWTWHPYEPEQ